MTSVTRRKVFYTPGFDPKGAKRYRALYRHEAKRWTQRFGGTMRFDSKTSDDDPLETRWRMTATLPPEGDADGAAPAEVVVDYSVFSWDDLVRERMSRPPWWRALRGTGAFLAMIVDGSLLGMLRLARIPTVVTLYPFLLASAYVLVALAILVGLPIALGALFGVSALWFAPLGLLGALLVFEAALFVDERTFALYLVDLYSYVRALSTGRAPELEDRMTAFAQPIVAAAQSGDYDEIIVVGHSGGGHLATSAVARAFAADPDLHRHGAAIGLLTLGQFLSAQMQFTPGDSQRAEYKSVARQDGLTWIDVSALSDAVCYGLCDPLAERGGSLPSAERLAGPKVISAAFKNTMAPESFEAIKRNHFRRHFQYLYMFEHPAAFDYFRITAGPRLLADRYRGVPTNRRAPPTAAEIGADAAPAAPTLAETAT